MTTNAQIITDALRDINVIPESASASAEQGKFGLRVLNRMLEEWTERDIDLGYFKQSSTTADIPIPAYAESAVTMQLSIRLAPNYGATISAELAMGADRAYTTLSTKAINEKLTKSDMDHLPVGEGRHGRGWDITTDV